MEGRWQPPVLDPTLGAMSTWGSHETESTPVTTAPEPPRRRPAWQVVAVTLLVVALVGTTTWAGIATSQRNDLAAEVDELESEISAQQTAITELERQVTQLEASGGGAAGGMGDLDGLLDGLLGGGGGDLDALMDGLLGGGGDLDGLMDGLLGGGDPGDLDALMDGLLGGEGGDLGGLLDGILGGDGDLGGLLDGILGDGADLGGLDMNVIGCVNDTVEGAPSGPLTATDAESQITEIHDRVAAMRQIDRGEDLEVELMPTTEFSQLIRDLSEEDLDRAAIDIDERYLRTLRAIDADLDLAEAQLDLIGDQAAGFYQPETERIVVAADDPSDGLTPIIQVIVAHEIEHALADAALGLPELGDTDISGDQSLAQLSAVEGDASLLMQQYTMSSLSMSEQLSMASDPAMSEQQDMLDAFPHYLQRNLMFPYLEGLNFTCALYAEGGWDAVDESYRTLPVTTAQILDADRYRAGDEGREIAAPAAPGGSWDELRTATFGAAELTWLLEAPGDDPAQAVAGAGDAAAAWDGGVAVVHADGDETALGIAVGDGTGMLCDALGAWATATFSERGADVDGATTTLTGDDGATVVACGDDEVRIGIAPDLDVAEALASAG